MYQISEVVRYLNSNDTITAIYAYTIGETAMHLLAIYRSFSHFRNQEKHNAFVNNFTMSDAGYVEPDVRYKYTDFSERVFANLAKKDCLGEKNLV